MNYANILRNKVVSNDKPLLSSAPKIVGYMNPAVYLNLRKHQIDISKFDYFTSDGIILKLLLNLFSRKKIERLSPDFSSYFSDLFANAEKTKKTLYILGTEESKIGLAVENIKQKYSLLNVVGFRNGYFTNQCEIDNNIEEILSINPDLLIVGMGTPAQEKYLLQLKNAGWTGAGFSCGGFLHQTASKIQYYPNWINKLNLRWLYRMYDEPKLIKRYFISYPLFVLVFFYDMYNT